MSGPAAPSHRYDVIVLGSGLAASILATILARHGVRVAIVAEDTHPRYHPGETQTPYAGWLLRLLALRHQVPELERLAGFRAIRDNVSRQVGRDAAIGFAYPDGTAGRSGGFRRVAGPPADPGAVLYRQDIDAYAFWTAVRYGAQAHQLARVARVVVTDDGVTVTTAGATTYRASYLVDATGRDSAAMASLDVPVRVGGTARPTRALHTHLVTPAAGDRATPGTLHHLFDGGHLTVSPFGNWPGAPNRLTGVRFTLDADRFAPGDDPEREFRTLLDRLPAAGRRLSGGAAVQPWISTTTQEYDRVRVAGDRWFALGQTAGYSAPFLSGAMTHEFQVVGALAGRLVDAVAAGDFRVERFGDVADLDRRIRAADRLLNTMVLDALTDPSLWRPVLRVWEVGQFFGVLQLHDVCRDLRRGGDDKAARTLEEAPYAGSVFPTSEEYHLLLAATAGDCRAVAERTADVAVVRARIVNRLTGAGFVPPALRPGARDGGGAGLRAARLLGWSRTCPPEIRRLVQGAAGDLFRGRV